jgi:hypothetical protein
MKIVQDIAVMCNKDKGGSFGDDVLNQSWDVYGTEHSLNHPQVFPQCSS